MSHITRIQLPIPFPIQSVNVYFIEDSNPTLIDAGFHSGEALDAMKHALRQRGFALSRIKRIILTHGHLDHVGLAGKIQEVSGAEIFIHPTDRGKCIWDVETVAAQKREPFYRFFEEAGLPEDVGREISRQMDARFRTYFPGYFDVKDLDGGDTFSFDDFTLEVVHCPGHTPGSVGLFDRDHARFYSGDHLLKSITSNPVVELENRGNGNPYKSLSHYLNSLTLTESLDIDEILPGHGRPFSGHRKRIQEIRAHHRLRREVILDVLKSRSPAHGGMNLFETAMEVFPHLKGWDIFLGMSETLGHLEILEEEGLIGSRLIREKRVYFTRS